MSRLRIRVTGRFHVEGPNGEDLTPRSAKECGLVALLIQSHGGVRARGWLQAHLWSDRGSEQAASSLRQAVYRVKKAFGAYASIVSSDRLCVGMDLDAVEIIDRPELEFLEGLDVRDEEFEGWLSTERASRNQPKAMPSTTGAESHNRLSPTRDIYIQFAIESSDLSASRWLGQMTSDLISRSLAETFDIAVRQTHSGQSNAGGWRIDVGVVSEGGRGHVVRLALVEVATGRSLWAQHEQIDGRDTDASQREELIVLVGRFTTAFSELHMDSLGNADILHRADALCHLAVGKLFSMQTDLVDEADRLFAEAYALKKRGLFLAWRAQVRQVQLVERIGLDLPSMREEAEAFARHAFEAEPNNSTVIALLAINRLHFGREIETATDYAQRAVKKNFSNTVAWWALSSAHLISNNPAKAYGTARIAALLAQGTPLEFWALSQLSGAAMAVRKLQEAKTLLRNVSFGRPNFRPPLRYLLAIHATDEEWNDAVAAVERLKQLEPGFSIDRFANDREYPVSLLHGSIGLDRERVMSLI